ncbi:hypothetical protein [Xanthomonas fragariae]|uniref:hypothetical protein n=3 Tax=Xanthomonas fragariae TaxID=48664 RepID=UPI000A35C91D|nr:hypothetical protein [Xanthomonas fragariae]MDM7556187.1 hypothetical protein [Xanthomonas fragariae]MDM7576957.1 hypothetical protein [Xanthomonas fragariae]SMQ96661.1 hypothetical protein NBC2815_03341 [Xanthomonas fragariae]
MCKMRSVTLAFMLVISGGATAQPKNCGFDKQAMLALTQDKFDQDVGNGGGGWRAVTSKPGCEVAAADLIKEYRKVHSDSSSLLFWHEGQLRAFAGNYEAAIPLMEASRQPTEKDLAGWNPYVDATIAFLRHDTSALVEAQKKLNAVPASPELPPVKDGYIEMSMGNGQKVKMRWPVNADVVDGLVSCLNKSYMEAYSSVCRGKSQ